jgi:hypothetical protein
VIKEEAFRHSQSLSRLLVSMVTRHFVLSLQRGVKHNKHW